MLKRLPLIPTLLVLAAVAVMVRLGFWQIDRMHQKDAMVAEFTAALESPSAEIDLNRDQLIDYPDPYVPVTVHCTSAGPDRPKSGRNLAGEAGWAHVFACRYTSPRGKQAEVRVIAGWSKAPLVANWQGGKVSGIVAPESMTERWKWHIIADPQTSPTITGPMRFNGSCSRLSHWSSIASPCASVLPRRTLRANGPAMEYVSTRGSAPALDFEGATLAGLASDGGLYVPREWPRFSEAEIAAMAGLPYAELAARIMQPFVGDSLTPERLRELTAQAYGRFAHGGDAAQAARRTALAARTVPRPDAGVQGRGAAIARACCSRNSWPFVAANLTIVGATSGDTGSAAIDAVAGRAPGRYLHAAPQGPGQRRAAPPDDHGAGAQRPQHRHRRAASTMPRRW
jgi:hypothetical protein